MKGRQGFQKRNNGSSFLFYKIHLRRYRNQSRVKQKSFPCVHLQLLQEAAVMWILSCPTGVMSLLGSGHRHCCGPVYSAADFKTQKLLWNLKWVSLPSHLPWCLYACLSPGYSCGPSKAMQFCCSQSSWVRSLRTHPGSLVHPFSLWNPKSETVHVSPQGAMASA